ncbi:MAG: glycosyltransferase [Ignavibacteria bacterium]|nr:glycosyltransferase [Ignavibacteria bacterium]
MSYRFVKITSFYRDFLRQYYQKNPEIGFRNYTEQLAHLFEQYFGWSNFYELHLRELGIEAYEIVSNAEILQNTWAKENGTTVTGKEIVVEQLKVLQPDVVMFQDSFIFNGEWINTLRERIPSIKLVIGFCCSPFSREHLEQFKVFDFSFVCSPKFLEDFTVLGLKAYELHHAFESEILEKLNTDNFYPETDLIFSGSIITGYGFHEQRQRILEELLKSKIDIKLLVNLPEINSLDLFMRRSGYVAAKILDKTGLRSFAENNSRLRKSLLLPGMPTRPKNYAKLLKIIQPPVFGLEMLKVLSHSKIGFNSHGEIAGDYAANVRLFEVTGAGSCLITDWKKNLDNFFDIDKEVVAYKSTEECIEKVQWLINHPKERNEIAKAGQKRTLRDHTFKQRAERLNSIIQKELLIKKY